MVNFGAVQPCVPLVLLLLSLFSVASLSFLWTCTIEVATTSPRRSRVGEGGDSRGGFLSLSQA